MAPESLGIGIPARSPRFMYVRWLGGQPSYTNFLQGFYTRSGFLRGNAVYKKDNTPFIPFGTDLLCYYKKEEGQAGAWTFSIGINHTAGKDVCRHPNHVAEYPPREGWEVDTPTHTAAANICVLVGDDAAFLPMEQVMGLATASGSEGGRRALMLPPPPF